MLQLNQLESVQLTPIEDSINQEREKAAESARLKNIQIPLRRILSFVVWYGMVAYLHLSRNLYCEARRVITRNHSRRKLQILGRPFAVHYNSFLLCIF